MTIEKLFQKLEELPLYEYAFASVFVDKGVEEGRSIEGVSTGKSWRQAFENFNKRFTELAKAEVKNFSFEKATLMIELKDDKKD